MRHKNLHTWCNSLWSVGYDPHVSVSFRTGTWWPKEEGGFNNILEVACSKVMHETWQNVTTRPSELSHRPRGATCTLLSYTSYSFIYIRERERERARERGRERERERERGRERERCAKSSLCYRSTKGTTDVRSTLCILIGCRGCQALAHRAVLLLNLTRKRIKKWLLSLRHRWGSSVCITFCLMQKPQLHLPEI